MAHLLLAFAVLGALGLALIIYLLFFLSDLLGDDLFDKGKGRILECVIFDEPFDLLINIVPVIDIAQTDALCLAFFANVDFDD